MSTVVYPCGCRISWSMFGDREIISVAPCYTHTMQLQEPMQVLVDKLVELQRPQQEIK